MEFLWFVALAALIAIAGMPLMEALASRAFDMKESRRRLTGQHEPLDSLAPQSKPAPIAPQPATADDAMTARLHDLSISFDGRDYRYAGYRYERRDDAIAYATLVRTRAEVARALT